jgi:hypothetical protein
MGETATPKRVEVFCGLLYRDAGACAGAMRMLCAEFGDLDVESDAVPFEFSTYYEAEMGPGLTRKFVSFKPLVLPEDSWRWKLFTNELEKEFLSGPACASRAVNIDPGYATLSGVVLLTTKDFYHRVYLARGIYAEMTLRWHNGRFDVFPWTYPDYATAHAWRFFGAVRKNLHEGLRGGAPALDS